jgi:hypothetical protein
MGTTLLHHDEPMSIGEVYIVVIKTTTREYSQATTTFDNCHCLILANSHWLRLKQPMKV